MIRPSADLDRKRARAGLFYWTMNDSHSTSTP